MALEHLEPAGRELIEQMISDHDKKIWNQAIAAAAQVAGEVGHLGGDYARLKILDLGR